MADEQRPMLVVADRQYENRVFADEYKQALKDPIDEAKRPGGYFIVNGYPCDCWGRRIPEAEWKPEDRERLLAGQPESEPPAPCDPPADGLVEERQPRKRK